MDRACTGNEASAGWTRRRFLERFGAGLGGVALADLLLRDEVHGAPASRGVLAAPHYPPRARRVIWLFQSGGPSQMDLFDYKPLLNERHGTELPAAVRRGQRLTGMSANQASLPLAGSPFRFARHGEAGAWISELLPHTARVADDLCIIRSIQTEAINHGPAVTFLQTGSQISGRPSFGAWLDYGLGSDSDELPSFVVLITKDKGGQPLVSRLWGSGFLSSRYEGVRFRSGADPILYLDNPGGIDRSSRRRLLDALRELHEIELARVADGAIETRIAHYEMAFRMQRSVPDVTDLSREPASTFALYGDDARNPGSFAANCLLARRLAERGVRFIQLYHPDWDHHGGLPAAIRTQCRETDRASAALIEDLKQRGLLDDTLVVWGGEFGRTSYCQGKLAANDFGRDHHPRCFTMWLAGGGVRSGVTYGATDEFGYNVVEGPVPVHDLHATLLYLLGIDHERLTYFFQGRRYRLTDVHGHVVDDLVA